MIISRNGGDLNNVFKTFHNAYIQCAAAKINHHHLPVLLLLCAVAVIQGGRGGFVDEALYCHASKLCCQLRSAALIVIKICWNTDHCLLHRLSQIPLCILQDLAQHQRRKLLWQKTPAAQRNQTLRTHPDFKGRRSALWIRDQPFLCGCPHQHCSVLQETYHTARLVCS